MEHLITTFVIIISWSLTSIKGSRFDPSKVKHLNTPPSDFLNASQLVTYYGYRSEVYEVKTEDGYILPLVRIANAPGPPILLILGLGIGPELWVLHGPGHDLGFILSDMGYDVWLGSQRGIDGSSHVYLDKSQPEFWDFSHDESGYYDIPAMVDLILSKSGYTKLFFGGTSLGSTLYMVVCSERPEYEAAFAGSVHFGPAMWISTLDQFTQGTQIILKSMRAMTSILDALGSKNLFHRSPKQEYWLKQFCGGPITERISLYLLNLLAGFDARNMAPGWTGYTLAESSSGTSVRSLEHLLQLTRKGGIDMYDWGPYGNLKRYGTYEPPSYNLTKISSPTAVYYSKIDKLVRYSAMKFTLLYIANLRHSMAVPDPTYGHAELVFGKDLYKLLYSDVVDFLDSLSGLNNSSKT